MAPAVLEKARIFEDPDPPKESRSHKRTTSVGDILRGRRKETSPAKQSQSRHSNHEIPSPLGERHINSPPAAQKIPIKSDGQSRPAMHKKSDSSSSIKGFLLGREKAVDGRLHPDKTEDSPKKNKSSTNLAGLLKKRSKKDLKENIPPSDPPLSPIHTEYISLPKTTQNAIPSPGSSHQLPQLFSQPGKTLAEEIARYSPMSEFEYPFPEVRIPQRPERASTELRSPQRPFLEHKTSRSSIFTENLEDNDQTGPNLLQSPEKHDQTHFQTNTPPHNQLGNQVDNQNQSPEKGDSRNRSSRIFDTIATLNMKAWRSDSVAEPQEHSKSRPLSAKELDSAMENMLGKYDIPQNLRDQLRNLKPEVKAGLMKGARIGSGSSSDGDDVRPSARRPDVERSTEDDGERKEGKRSRSQSRSRPRSRILSLTKRGENSPTKQEGSGRARSKSRPKSVEISQSSSSVGMLSTASLGSFSPQDSATTPGDFIHYLKEIQKPELVEVGKIHKLRVLLRNESVAWTDAFVKKGGMDEIVSLLYRIMGLEWREEHEDTLLHHCLACLKGLSTTSLAMQRLEKMSQTLFPALLKMLFDPERKGPAEYNTRGLIVSLLFSYLSATLHEDSTMHIHRVQEVVSFLKDAAPENEKQLVDFVSQMHTSRPFRAWFKEVNSITKEVFWIFLHQMNVIPILDVIRDGEDTFVRSYFPAARAPHPAAPYVGGVEWEATQYLANHLDLLNGIICSFPTRSERNALREDFRQSGWEKLMGQTLRTCKEKFYTGVHDGLRTWVAAGKQDGWYVEDVRAGPPRENMSPQKKPVKQNENAPQIALDIGAPLKGKDENAWL